MKIDCVSDFRTNSGLMRDTCVNRGDRQSGRLPNENAFDRSALDGLTISESVATARKMTGPIEICFGVGTVDKIIVTAIKSLEFGLTITARRNTY